MKKKARFLPLFCCILFLELTSCVSIPQKDRLPMTSDLNGFFKPCTPSDGGHAAQLLQEDRLIGNAEIQWLAQSGENWDIEVNTHFGQPLGRWSLKQKKSSSGMIKLHRNSNLLKKMPPVELDPNGYIHIDGNKIALRGDEIPCILSGVVPLKWAESLTGKTANHSQVSLEFEAQDRRLHVSIDPLHNKHHQRVKVCARIEWDHLFFWEQKIEWCTLRQKKAAPSHQKSIKGEYPEVRLIEVSFEGYQTYSLRMTPLNEVKTANIVFPEFSKQ